MLVCHFLQVAGSRKKKTVKSAEDSLLEHRHLAIKRRIRLCIYIERGRSDGKEPRGLTLTEERKTA